MNTDFIGFSFDGVHSSTLNLLRVANGDRYSEEILPEINDNTVERSGRDGVYYYGSFYKSKTIEIDIAFDSVTEEQYRNIRRLFGQKELCPLIFDERPYKVYYAKVADPITLETICFDEEDYYWDPTGHRPKEKIVVDAIVDEAAVDETAIENSQYQEGVYIPGSINHKVYTGQKRRIYKGEGSISFICYDPFARQQYKQLDLYESYGNVDEWAASSGILTTDEYVNGAYDTFLSFTNISDIRRLGYNGQFNVYNPGDIDTPYYIFLPYTIAYEEVTGDFDKRKIYYILNNGEYEKVTNLEEFADGVTYYTQKRNLAPADGNYITISCDFHDKLEIKPFTSEGDEEENGVIISSRAELIEGVHYDYNLKIWRRTGKVYNKYINRGSFGKIHIGDKFDFRKQGIYLNCLVENSNYPAIFYNYLYF